MTPLFPGKKKGQQLIMPMARLEQNPDILYGHKLQAIDLRLDWQKILLTIEDNKNIQQAMGKSYQDSQEGFKLKDFKYHNGVKGVWSFNDTKQGIYPYTLTTTEWINQYEEKEWEAQASADEWAAKSAINTAIDKCANMEENLEMLTDLESAKNKLARKYLPRANQPESWRPQNAPHWSSQWIKLLADIHYHFLSHNWKIVSTNSHSIVAGFSNNKIAYLIDIILLTTNSDKIIKKLNQE